MKKPVDIKKIKTKSTPVPIPTIKKPNPKTKPKPSPTKGSKKVEPPLPKGYLPAYPRSKYPKIV